MSDNVNETTEAAADIAAGLAEPAEVAVDIAAAEVVPTEAVPASEGETTESSPAATTEGDQSTATEAPAAAAAPEAAAPAAPPRRGRPRTRLEDVVVGTPIHGRVVGLAKFGAFVDIGAMTDGLVHISEFSQRGVRKVEDVLKSGDAVDVWVKDVDVAGNKISLTMREPARHPMTGLKEGDVLTGRVTTIAKYGAFVDIGSETEGLVHISEMSSGFVQRAEDVVQSGQAIEVRIKEIDRSKPRISLSMRGLGNDVGLGVEEEAAPAQGGIDDYGSADEVEERGPTVVELALRRALGEAAPDDAGGKSSRAGKPSGRPSKQSNLSDVYTRMIEEYRQTKASEK